MPPFKVMTFNIKGAFFDDGEYDWAHRESLNLGTIMRHTPDLIGFQEVQTPTLEAYQTHLTMYTCELGPETARENSTGHGYLNAIFWNPARFDKRAAGSFYLSPTPEVYSRDWGTSEVRGVTWVRLHDRETGHDFLHFNSHFPHDAELARIESVGVVTRQLTAWRGNLPVVLTADFNSRARDIPIPTLRHLPEALSRWLAQDPIPPGGTVHQRFLDYGFRDTFDETGHMDAPTVNTYHHMLGRQFPPFGYRIDWILLLDGAQRWQAHTSTILLDEAPPLYPSDHYPVMAEVSLA